MRQAPVCLPTAAAIDTSSVVVRLAAAGGPSKKFLRRQGSSSDGDRFCADQRFERLHGYAALAALIGCVGCSSWHLCDRLSAVAAHLLRCLLCPNRSP